MIHTGIGNSPWGTSWKWQRRRRTKTLRPGFVGGAPASLHYRVAYAMRPSMACLPSRRSATHRRRRTPQGHHRSEPGSLRLASSDRRLNPHRGKRARKPPNASARRERTAPPPPPPPSAASALPAASSGGGEGKEAWGEVEVVLVAAARVGSLVLAEYRLPCLIAKCTRGAD